MANKKKKKAKAKIKKVKQKVTKKKASKKVSPKKTAKKAAKKVLQKKKTTKTAGGIYIPNSVTESGPIRGRVLAVGRGHLNKKGLLRPMDVRVGDVVLYNKYAGSEMNLNQQPVFVLREEDVLGIVE